MAGAVDLKTGKIIGCKVGSLTWFHEFGHILYNNSPKSIHLKIIQDWCLKIFFVFVWVLFKYQSYYVWFPTGILLITYFVLDIYEELWCWVYALKNVGNKRKSKDNKS